MSVQGTSESIWSNKVEAKIGPTPEEAKLKALNLQLIANIQKLQTHVNKLSEECTRLNSENELLSMISGPANVLVSTDTVERAKGLFQRIIKQNGTKKLPVVSEMKEVLPELEAMQQNLNLLRQGVERAVSVDQKSVKTAPIESKELSKVAPFKSRDRSQSIQRDEEVLVRNLEILNLLDETFRETIKENESLLLGNLDAYKKEFNDCVKEINAQYLARVEEYRAGLKSFIDYLVENGIKTGEHHSIAQHLFFSDKVQVEEFNHSIPFDIKKFMETSSEQVNQSTLSNAEWISRFERHHDDILKNLLEIKRFSHNIEWKLSFYEYKSSLFHESTELKSCISELNGNIGEISASLSNATKHRESTLTHAKGEKDAAVVRFNEYVQKAKELTIRVEREKEALSSKISEQENCALKTMCESMHFYDAEMEKEFKELNATFLSNNSKEMELHLEDLKVSLNLITFDLSKNALRPAGINRDSLYFMLKQLASSIETKGGEIRTGMLYRAKEWVGSNNEHGLVALDSIIVTELKTTE